MSINMCLFLQEKVWRDGHRRLSDCQWCQWWNVLTGEAPGAWHQPRANPAQTPRSPPENIKTWRRVGRQGILTSSIWGLGSVFNSATDLLFTSKQFCLSVPQFTLLFNQGENPSQLCGRIFRDTDVSYLRRQIYTISTSNRLILNKCIWAHRCHNISEINVPQCVFFNPLAAEEQQQETGREILFCLARAFALGPRTAARRGEMGNPPRGSFAITFLPVSV